MTNSEAQTPMEELHRYCRDIQGVARRHCERLKLDPDSCIEMPWQQSLWQWQLVAGDLLRSFSDRLPPDEAEALWKIGNEYIFADAPKRH